MNQPNTTPGLEYLLLFGLPENKTEVFGGRMRTIWPFLELRDAEETFALWRAQIERWHGVSGEEVAGNAGVRVELGGITLERTCRVVELLIPIHVDTLLALDGGFWRRELWELPPDHDLPGYDNRHRNSAIRMNLWKIFEPWDKRGSEQRRQRFRGRCLWGDVMLTDDTSLFLDFYWFGEEAPMELIGGDFPAGVPLAAAQMLAPFSREVDRGPRLALLHRAGVEHLWLLDPALETVETLVRGASGYTIAGIYGSGEVIQPLFCPETTVSVEALFDDPYEERMQRSRSPEPGDHWRTEPGRSLGLEYPLLLGHPARRYEIWRDHCPCVLAFGSPVEARSRFRDFLLDAERWTGAAALAVKELAEDGETARLGQFQFTRRRNRVYLDVDVDPHVYRTMLMALADRELWEERNQAEGGAEGDSAGCISQVDHL